MKTTKKIKIKVPENISDLVDNLKPKREDIDGPEKYINGIPVWKSSSGNYFLHIDREGTYHFYTLDDKKIPHLCNYCEDCGVTIISKRPGHFITCPCGKVGVDTDRWPPGHGRYLGTTPSVGTIILDVVLDKKWSVQYESEILRSVLSVAKGQRIGQWIHNLFRDMEIEHESGARGIDIFNVSDQEFIRRIKEGIN